MIGKVAPINDETLVSEAPETAYGSSRKIGTKLLQKTKLD